METVCYTPIGVVRSPWTSQAGTPLQTIAGSIGTVELEEHYAAGLKDLDGFAYLWLLVHLHQTGDATLEVIPYLDTRPHGVFATRSPRRPNPIGLSLVRFLGIEGCRITIEAIDLLDGTPVLDIKPYVPLFDQRETTQIGWFAETIQHVYTVRADERFS